MRDSPMQHRLFGHQRSLCMRMHEHPRLHAWRRHATLVLFSLVCEAARLIINYKCPLFEH